MASQFKGYGEVKVGNIPAEKLKKSLQGKAVRLTKQELIGDRVMIVHPRNAKAIKKAQKMGAGLTTSFTPGEAAADLNHYKKMGGALAGGSLWNWLEKAGRWLKDSGVGSVLADAGQELIKPFVGETGAKVARDIVRTTTGVGLKGSQEMKDKMAAIRAKRGAKRGNNGGSFSIN